MKIDRQDHADGNVGEYLRVVEIMIRYSYEWPNGVF